jgi:hypothetical protein
VTITISVFVLSSWIGGALLVGGVIGLFAGGLCKQSKRADVSAEGQLEHAARVLAEERLAQAEGQLDRLRQRARMASALAKDPEVA